MADTGEAEAPEAAALAATRAGTPRPEEDPTALGVVVLKVPGGMAKEALMLNPSMPKSNGVVLRPLATSALPVRMVPPEALAAAVALMGDVAARLAPELDEMEALDRCPGVGPAINDVSQSVGVFQNNRSAIQRKE